MVDQTDTLALTETQTRVVDMGILAIGREPPGNYIKVGILVGFDILN